MKRTGIQTGEDGTGQWAATGPVPRRTRLQQWLRIDPGNRTVVYAPLRPGHPSIWLPRPSYEYVMRELQTLGGTLAHGRVIIAHLGSGASMIAVRDGKSIDTSMGFPLLKDW